VNIRKCPGCKEKFSFPLPSMLQHGSKKKPIQCPTCQRQYFYDGKHAFFISDLWGYLILSFFLYRWFLAAYERTNHLPLTVTPGLWDTIAIPLVAVVCLFIRLKYANLMELETKGRKENISLD